MAPARARPTTRLTKRIAALLLVAMAGVARGQGDGWLIDHWTTADGLPVNGVNRVHVGASGYLWLATFDGLVRFDGHRFATFDAPYDARLPSNRLVRLLESPAGLLWVSTDTARLASFDGHAFRAYGVADGLPSETVNGVHIDRHGTFWAFTAAGLARRVDAQRFETWIEDPRFGPIGHVEPAADGSLWVASETGLHRFDGKRWLQSYGPAQGVPAPVFYIDLDPQDRVWIPAGEKLLRLGPDGIVGPLLEDESLFRAETRGDAVAIGGGFVDFLVHADGRIERRRRESRYQSYGDERLLRHAPDGALWHNRFDVLQREGETVFEAPCKINDFDFDATGAVWVASACDGLYRLRPRRIEALTEVGGQRLGSVYGLAEAPDGALWIGTLDRGVAIRAADGSARWLKAEHGIVPVNLSTIFIDADGATWIAHCRMVDPWRCQRPPDWPREVAIGDTVRALHRGRDGSLWIGGFRLWRIDPQGGLQSMQAESGLSEDDAGQVRAILELADGTLFFGTRGRGVLRRSPQGAYRLFSTADGLSSNVIRALRADRDGRLWVATENRGLCRISDPSSVEPGLLQYSSLRDAPIESVRDAPIESVRPEPVEGRLTARRGLRQAQPERLPQAQPERLPQAQPERLPQAQPERLPIACLDRRHGLASDSLHQILFDDDERAWLNSNHGVFAVPRAALDAVLDGHAARVHPQRYTERDGLPSREGNGGVNDAGIRLKDGRIAFPGQNGVAVFDPRDLQPLAAPVRAVFETLELPGGRSLPAASRVALDPGERSLTLRYTGLSPSLTAPVYFRYRLDAEQDWIELGEARQIDLHRLPPGARTVELLAFGSSGETGDPTRLALSLPPYWYETAAFRAAAPLALALVVLGWFLRQRRLAVQRQRELAATVAERTAELSAALGTVRAQNDEIERLAMTKTRFFANVSHELRTPLALLVGPLDDYARGRPPTPALVVAMASNAHRLERLIGQLLDLERIDARRFPLRPQPLDLLLLARESLTAFAPLAVREGIALEADLPDAPAPAHGDAEQLMRVLANLLSNALKFCPAGGRVRLTLAAGEAGAALRVEDAGPGVPPEWRERIFDRFSQMGGDATRSREGAGLGLALCREVAELHGGRLRVADSPLGGAAFVFELPPPQDSPLAEQARRAEPAQRIPPSSPPDVAESPAVVPPYGASSAQTPDLPLVLLAEDNPDLRRYLAEVLAERYRVAVAEDGEIALRLAREEPPDLIVTDLMMPNLDGLGLAQAVREEPELAGVPIVFLTARASDADRVKGLSGGADHYLTKPFDSQVLLAQLAAALRACQRLREHYAQHAVAASEPTAARSAFSARLDALFEANAHDPDFGLSQMVQTLHMSEGTLRRRCQAELGASPGELLRRHRLERAHALLEQGTGNVSEVAYAVGYASLGSFSRAYRERFGHPPARG